MALTQISTKGLKDGTILNADINASASIAGTKISPSFGSQNISTTGTTSIGGATSVGTKLHIENSSGDAHIRLRGSANYGVLFTRHSDAALTGYVGSGNAVNLGSSNVALSAPISGGHIIFQTNGPAATDEKMRIKDNGTVGIGTTAPNAKLEIASNHSQLRLKDTDDSKFCLFSYSGGKLITRNNSTSTTTAQFTLDESGKLGIGTISPAVELDVRSTSQSTNTILGNFESSAASSGLSSTTVRLIKGTGFGGAIGGFINQGVGSGLLFNTINGGAEATKMSIKNNGFVGIGDDLFDPSYRLHVKDGSTDLISFFQNNKTGNGDIGYISVGLNNFANTGLALFGHTGHTTAGSQAAWFGLSGDDVAGGTGVKAFRGGTIFMAGQLNIGNNNAPNVQARISTSTGQFGAFLETTGTTAVNGIPLIVNRQADNGVMIEFKKSNGVVATISRNSSNLMVYGGQSDYRLKENNVAISDSLTKVKSLKPYEFNWKDIPDTKVLGFFAHELQEVVPQAVTGTKDEMYEDDDPKPKYQNVDNSHIVPLLVAAVQELTIKTEALETEVAALKAS